MQYEKFRQYLVGRGNNLVFVNQSLGRAEVIEKLMGVQLMNWCKTTQQCIRH